MKRLGERQRVMTESVGENLVIDTALSFFQLETLGSTEFDSLPIEDKRIERVKSFIDSGRILDSLTLNVDAELDGRKIFDDQQLIIGALKYTLDNHDCPIIARYCSTMYQEYFQIDPDLVTSKP